VLKMRVRDVMSVPAVVGPNDSLFVAEGTMCMGAVRHLPVVDGDELVGIISERDVLRAPGVLADHGPSARSILQSARVAAVMSRNPVTTRPEASIAEAANALATRRVGCLPVLEDGRLVGIVTRTDVLSALGIAVGARPTERPDAYTATREVGQEAYRC
jgi:acetoin utilization protein AcuB